MKNKIYNKRFTKIITGLIVLTVALGSSAEKPKNILLILMEDQGCQMSALGTKGLHTPNMDRLPELYRMICEQDPYRLKGKVPPMELYDLKSDPWEMENLIDDPSYKKERERMLNVLKDFSQLTGDTYITLGQK